MMFTIVIFFAIFIGIPLTLIIWLGMEIVDYVKKH